MYIPGMGAVSFHRAHIDLGHPAAVVLGVVERLAGGGAPQLPLLLGRCFRGASGSGCTTFIDYGGGKLQ